MTVTMNETLPAVRCTSWCEDGSGHTDAGHHVDQWCYGTRHIVKLTREALLTYGDGERKLDHLDLYLAKEAEGRTHVHLGRNEQRGVELTLDEVRELRDALSDVRRTASLSV